MEIIMALAAGCATGILSGWGVGGGTLLLVYLTGLAGIAQTQAQGINLLYFLPCSAAAIFFHLKNGLVEKPAVMPAAAAGAVSAAVFSFIALGIDPWLLKKLFGAFLLIIGVRELFRK